MNRPTIGVCSFCSTPLDTDGECPTCGREAPRSWLSPIAVVIGLIVVGAFLFYAVALWYVSPWPRIAA